MNRAAEELIWQMGVEVKDRKEGGIQERLQSQFKYSSAKYNMVHGTMLYFTQELKNEKGKKKKKTVAMVLCDISSGELLSLVQL